MTHVPPPEQVCAFRVHEFTAQTPRTTPASTGRHTLENRPVQSLSVLHVGWHAESMQAVPFGHAPASPQLARHSTWAKPWFDANTQFNPGAQAAPSVHGSPWVRSCGPASPALGEQLGLPPQLQPENHATAASTQRVRMATFYYSRSLRSPCRCSSSIKCERSIFAWRAAAETLPFVTTISFAR